MKFLVSITVLVATLTVVGLCLADEQPSSGQPSKQQAAAAASAPSSVPASPSNIQEARQGRSISSGGSSGNSLSSGSSNIIEHGSSFKSRKDLEAEKRQVQEFLTTKNIFKSIMKLLLGNPDEISATSRNVLGILSKVLDLLKNTFSSQKLQRSSTVARGIRDYSEDIANAGVSMLQGYVKSVLATDATCAKRYLCEASQAAHREARELGHVIASVGGYATSYLLDNSRSSNFNGYYEASAKGRQMKEEDGCRKVFTCDEKLPPTN